MKSRLVILPLLSTLVLGACANMSETQRNTAIGAGIGALGGAVISKSTGGNKTGRDAAIGAGDEDVAAADRVAVGRARFGDRDRRTAALQADVTGHQQQPAFVAGDLGRCRRARERTGGEGEDDEQPPGGGAQGLPRETGLRDREQTGPGHRQNL